MQRKTFLRSSALVIGGISLAGKSFFARNFQEPMPYKMKMLRNDIGIFTEKGGTIVYMFGKDGTVVVDSEFPQQANHLIEALKNNRTIPLKC